MATLATWRDYYELCKPRVVALMLLTALVGMQLASPGLVPLNIFIFGILGIALCAGAAATINHLVDQRIDAIMARTQKRPIASGRVSARNAIYFSIILACTGMFILITYVNILTAVLTFFTLIGYAGIYTLLLKRTTPQNIVIGGLAGAAPPLLGWTAVTGHLDPQSLLLVLIIFVWTPPHFWALAIARYEDYKKAEVPMLPVTHGVRFTRLNVLLYTILLCVVSLLPYVIEMSGLIYLVGAVLLDIGFLYYAVRLYNTQDNSIAMRTFWYSIFYLMVLFVVLLVDHYFYL